MRTEWGFQMLSRIKRRLLSWSPRVCGRERAIDETVERRVQLGVQQAIAYAAERVDQLSSNNEAILHHLPGFLNAAATVPALARKLASQQVQCAAAERDFAQLLWEVRALKEEQTGGTADRAEMRRILELAAAESKTLREEQTAGVTDRGNLWKSIEQAAGELRAVKEEQTAGSSDRANLWKSVEQATSEIGKLWRRVEFVRTEIMYEMRYAILGTASNLRDAKRARIVNQTALVPANQEELKINIGCGHVPLNGYVNVDARELPGVDVVADAGDLPFEQCSLAEVFSAHVLEHFPEQRLRRLLPYWKGLLKPGSTFRAIVPDGEAMLAGIAAGTYGFGDFRMVLFGEQEYEGDFHFNLFIPDSLAAMLQEAGFKDVAVPVRGRKNGNCFEFEIVAFA